MMQIGSKLLVVKIHFHLRLIYSCMLQVKRKSSIFHFAVPERLTIFLILYGGIIVLAEERSTGSVTIEQGPITPKKPTGSFVGFNDVVTGERIHAPRSQEPISDVAVIKRTKYCQSDLGKLLALVLNC